MKVLHVIPTYYPATYWGGPIFSTLGLNNALARIPGVEVKVLTTDAAGPRVTERLDEKQKRFPFRYTVIYARRVAGVSVSIELLKLLPAMIRWADVVHLTAVYSFPTIPTLVVANQYNKPVVWSLRGALLDDQLRREFDPQPWSRRIAKLVWISIIRGLLSENTILHATTCQERDVSAKVFPKSRFVVIPNGVEIPENFPSRYKRQQSRKRLRLMYIGRLAPKKGIENLLQALALVDFPIELDIYGEATAGQGGKDYGKNLVDLADELGILNQTVRFHGRVDGAAKERAFLNADVCVIPSYSENFGIVVVEALAREVPVIVSACLPQWSSVERVGCGVWVDNDPVSLARAIKSFYGKDLQEMGRKGRTWVISEFSWEKIAHEFYKVYTELIGRREQ